MSAFLSVHAGNLTFHAKPSALDTVLWQILGMDENELGPRSLRAVGAFSCHTPPFATEELDVNAIPPGQLARRFLAFATATAPLASSGLHGDAFVQFLLEHPHQLERGAYAVTIVCALVSLRRIAEAEQLARAYASGQRHSVSQLSSRGKDFHELAVSWIQRSGLTSA